MPDKFSAARWLALAVYLAGLVFIFITNNTRWWTLFCLVASLLFCFDLFVLTPRPKLSLLNAGDDAKPKFQRSGLMWVAVALVVIGCLDSPHIRASALLIMSGLCVAAFDQYRRTKANSVARN
jgi:hypothetical protein